MQAVWAEQVFPTTQHCRQTWHQAGGPIPPFLTAAPCWVSAKRDHWHMGMREQHLRQNYFCGRQWFIILVEAVAHVLWATRQGGGQAGTHSSFVILHPIKDHLEHCHHLNFWHCSGVTMLIEGGAEKSPSLSLLPSTVKPGCKPLLYALSQTE